MSKNKVPAKGKPVQYTFNDRSKTIQYSLGTTDSFGNLRTSEYSDGKGKHDTWSKWQEVEIVPVVHVPEEGAKVYGWDTEKRPESPMVWYSNGELVNGALSVYAYKEMGTKNDITTVKHWEKMV